MTNTPENPKNQTDSPRSRRWRRIIIISGLGLGTVSVAVGVVGTWWLKEKLAPMLSANLTRLAQRPVKVGELKKFGLGYIEFGPSSVPPTSTDSIAASTEVVKVTFPLGPLLFKTLKLDITFGDSEARLEQRPDGSFQIPELADLPPPPLNIEIVALRFPELDVTVEPSQGEKPVTPILLDLSNSEVLSRDEQQRWLIDLNGDVIDGGNFQVNADINLQTSDIKVDLAAQKLQLPKLAQLAKTPNVNLQRGELSADLTTQLKLTENVADIVQDIQGKFSIQQLQANSDLLINPVNLNTVANVAWPQVNVENFNASYGPIGLLVKGAAQTGADFDPQNIRVNLNAALLPVTFNTIFNTATAQINLLSNQIESAESKEQLQQIQSQIQDLKPLLEGAFKSNINISGSLLQPVVSGQVQTTEITRVDRLRFQDIGTKFTVSPQFNQEFQPLKLSGSFSELQINPVVGGKITGKGAIVAEDLGTTQTPPQPGVEQEPENNFNPLVGLNLQVQNLPVEAIAQQYGFSVPVAIGDFSSDVEIAGALESLKGQIQWQLPKAVYPVSGSIDIADSQAEIKNTAVQIGGGTVEIDGNANLENWQINATANRVALDNLEPLQPLGIPPELEGMFNGQFNVSGPTSNFTTNGINGGGSGVLNIASGQINLTGEINNGSLQGRGRASQLSLSSLERIARKADILNTPNPILSAQTDGTLNGEATVSANLNDLSLAGITSNIDGNVNIANGTINANADINNGNLQASVYTAELPVNPLLDLGRSAVDSGIINDPQQINNIQTNIPRLKTLNGRLTGRVDVLGDLANLAPENLTGDLVGNLQIDAGTINARGGLNSGNFQTTVTTNQISLTALENLLTKTEVVAQQTDIFSGETNGQIQGAVTVSGNINNLSPEGININSDGKLTIARGTVNAKGQINDGNFQASVNSSKLAVNPLLDIGTAVLASGLVPVEPTQVQNLQAQIAQVKALNSQLTTNTNISGNLTNLNPEAITATTNNQLIIDDNTIDINGKLNLGNFLATVETERIALSSLEQTIRKSGLVSLPETAILPPEITGAIIGNASVFGNLNNLNPNAIVAQGDGQLIVGNNTANAQASLNNGNFQATVIAEPIPISTIEQIALQTGTLPETALPYVGIINGNILGEARVAGNLDNLNSEAIAAEAEGKLILADGGAINVTGELVGQQWQASVVGNQIPLEQFAAELEARKESIPAVAAIKQAQQLLGQAENLPVIGGFFNTNIDISGTLANLSPEAIRAQAKATLSELPVIQKPLNSLFNWDGEQIKIEQVAIPPVANASGVVGVDFPPQNGPTISGVNIDVNLSDFDLASLPIQQFAQNLPIQQKGDLLAGRVSFDGKVTGSSIDNLSLAGDVVLRNLAVNQVDFDSVLSGNLNAGINQGVTFQVAGNQDRLELVLDEGYFPTAFLVKRDEAQLAGVTQGENLVVTLDEFPLELLALAPAAQLGLGPLSGEASAEIAVSGLRTFDLNSIQADGKIAVDQPSIGYIDADSFTAEISYGNGKAALNDGTLLLGESKYVLEGLVDISQQTPVFNPQFLVSLEIEKGEVQDILTALQWYTVADIGRGFATPNYASAAEVQPVGVGFPDNTPVILQLRRFAEIQALLQQQQESQTPDTPVPIPPLADLDVGFSGKIVAEGSLQSGVEAEFNIEGSDWNWGPYVTDRFLLRGNYENAVLTVEPLRIQIGEAVLALAGNISPESQSAELEVKNIDLAEVQKFANTIGFNYLPPNIDIKGELNAAASLGGNLDDPRAAGEINIVDGSLNGEAIETANTSFSYNIGRLIFGGNISITGDPILFTGNVPIDLPFAQVSAGSDIIDVSVNVKNEALEIANLFTDELNLDVGQADILLRVRGTLKQPQAEGFAKFSDTTIIAAAFPSPLTDLEGTVLFEGDRIKVKEIQGNLSDGIVAVSGVLPIFASLNQEDPDLENPLTITLDKLNVDFKEAFVGGIDGTILIEGAALRPEIGGNVSVSQGRIFLNKAAGLAPTAGDRENASVPGVEGFEVAFNNFDILLTDSLRMVSPGLVNFEASGGFRLNGTLNDPRPSGTINLESGVINLFSTDLRLDRSYQNTATFIPNNGLDPILNVQLVASAFETSGTVAPSKPFSAETIDAPAPGILGSSRRIKVMATVKGSISQLEQNIELTSSPPRSDAQIVSLLGGSVINTLKGDQGLALANVATTTLFTGLQQDIIDATGLSEFRIFPANIPKRGSKRASSLGWGLEVGVDVTENLGVSMTRLFGANEPTEFSLRYQINDEVRVRGGSNFDDNSVLSVEYEVQF